MIKQKTQFFQHHGSRKMRTAFFKTKSKTRLIYIQTLKFVLLAPPLRALSSISLTLYFLLSSIFMNEHTFPNDLHINRFSGIIIKYF